MKEPQQETSVEARRARAVRNALLLGGVALAVYLGFIGLGILRG